MCVDGSATSWRCRTIAATTITSFERSATWCPSARPRLWRQVCSAGIPSRLVAIAALLRHVDRERVKIGVGGALIQFHPTYHDLLQQKLEALAPDNVQVRSLISPLFSKKVKALLVGTCTGGRGQCSGRRPDRRRRGASSSLKASSHVVRCCSPNVPGLPCQSPARPSPSFLNEQSKMNVVCLSSFQVVMIPVGVDRTSSCLLPRRLPKTGESARGGSPVPCIHPFSSSLSSSCFYLHPAQEASVRVVTERGVPLVCRRFTFPPGFCVAGCPNQRP